MSKVVEINFKPDERTLRQFGFIALFGFGLFGLLAWKEWLIFAAGLGSLREPLAYGFFGLGVVSLLFSLVWPKANWPIFVGLSVIAFPIGFVLSYVIMGVLFFLIIAPIAILLRVLGKDPMNRKYDRAAPSYWQKLETQRDQESYFRQF